MAITRDYTKEVGVLSPKKTMPRPLAFIVLAIVAVGISFGVTEIVRRGKQHQRAEKSAGAAPSAAATP